MDIKNHTNTIKKDVINVCFIGLPSAGKTTLVNSLIGKRVLHTGLCRTTLKPNIIGNISKDSPFNILENDIYEYDIKSDDGIMMNIIDLPGICDLDDIKKDDKTDFNTITHKWVKNADVIYWVSDATTAFQTTHEKNEFDNILSILETEKKENGTLFQLGIMLTKFDKHEHNEESNTDDEFELISNDEIQDYSEETTIDDSFNRVMELFQDYNIKVIKYNAFGRILHKNSTKTLRNLIKRQDPYASKENIDFKIGWVLDNFYEKQQKTYMVALKHQLIQFFEKYKYESNGSRNAQIIGIGDIIKKINSIINKITMDCWNCYILKIYLADTPNDLNLLLKQIDDKEINLNLNITYFNSTMATLVTNTTISHDKRLVFHNTELTHNKINYKSKEKIISRIRNIFGKDSWIYRKYYFKNNNGYKDMVLFHKIVGDNITHVNDSYTIDTYSNYNTSRMENSPSICYFDKLLFNDNTLCIRNEWTKLVLEERQKIWGDEDVDIQMICNMVMNKKMKSLFAQL